MSINRQKYLELGAKLLYLLQEYPNSANQQNYNNWFERAKPSKDEMLFVYQSVRLYKRGLPND